MKVRITKQFASMKSSYSFRIGYMSYEFSGLVTFLTNVLLSEYTFFFFFLRRERSIFVGCYILLWVDWGAQPL